jgi:ketosteroid isomerase-like protein
MSEENVEAFKRGIEAFHRRDMETVLEVHDPKVEWHPMIQVLLGGEATVYRGHEGVREQLRDLDEAFTEIHFEISEIRDLGDRLLANGRIRARGKESGVETQSPISFLADFKNGKVIRAVTYPDPKEALETAGLSE